MFDMPTIEWPADPQCLYTLFQYDVTYDGFDYYNWLVTNIPGNDIAAGDTKMDYLPAFLYKLELDNATGTWHMNEYPEPGRSVFLIFKQKNCEPIDMEEGIIGCSRDISRLRAAVSVLRCRRIGNHLNCMMLFLSQVGPEGNDELITLSKFQTKYELEGPVAGNFIRQLYSGEVTKAFMCYMTKCQGYRFPRHKIAPGINDLPQCQ